MKLALLLTLAFSFSAFTCPIAQAHSPMEEAMEEINDAAKPLGKALAAPDPTQKETYLKWVKTIKTEATKCLDLVPEKVANLPADEKAPQIAAYKKQMEKFIADVEVLEKEIEKDKWAEAGKAYQQLRADMKEGHHDFRKPKK